VREQLALQKLLTASLASAIVETGSSQVGGYVTTASEVAGLRTPTDLLAAYGIYGTPEFVDVARFEQPRLAALDATHIDERTWTTFPTGFLLGDSLARVWRMGRTRYPIGAEYWRIRSDGEQKCLSRYGGVGRGWTGARLWRSPSALVGTMARWRGIEFFADVQASTVLLTSIADDGPAGFERIRPTVWSKTVPATECEVFERVYTALLDGVPVRLLRHADTRTEVVLLSDDPLDAGRVGAENVELGVFELTVDTHRLTNLQGVENQMVTASG
jgi:hypothetical protein